MHGPRLDILTWILGADSTLFRRLTTSPQSHALPEIELSLLLRCFEQYALEACEHQSVQSRKLRCKHFDNPIVATECDEWRQQTRLQTGSDSLMRLICICILVRDFDDIREFVEHRWVQTVAVDPVADAAAVQTALTARQFAHRKEMVRQCACIIVQNIPHFTEYNWNGNWSLRNETWKTAHWYHVVRRVNTEARVIFCGEVIQAAHDASVAATALCDFLGGVRGSLSYTTHDVLRWWHDPEDKNNLCYNMAMVCDVYNYQSWTATVHNVTVPPIPHEQRATRVTMETLRILVVFCSNLVCKVESGLLHDILPIDLDTLKLLVVIFDKVRCRDASQQQLVVAAVNRVTKSVKVFVQMHCACSEMERCLRLYVYLNHLQSPSNTVKLLAHIVREGSGLAGDDMCRLFRRWLCNFDGLCSRDCMMSAAVITWGGRDLANFCILSSVYLREQQPPVHEMFLVNTDGTLGDASHLLDPLLFHEVFAENSLLDA